MDILADTNILVRRINRFDSQHRLTRSALSAAKRNGHRMCIVPQNILECWNVCTRPVAQNGLGLLPSHLERISARIEARFHLFPEAPGVFTGWKQLVAAHSVSGLKVYDARLVVSALANRVGAILTFNVADFRRYNEVKILHPRDLV